MTDPTDVPHPDLAAVPGPRPDGRRTRLRRAWAETWRLGLALLFSLTATGFVLVEIDEGRMAMTGGQLALDIALGVLCFGAVLLRHRFPTTVALVVSAAGAVSAFAVGPITLAIVSLATHRRWWRILAVAAVFTVAGWTYGQLYPTTDPAPVTETLLGVAFFALLVWIGAYIGLRREHIASLYERIATAEREQAGRVAQARANERARIAREMHDVLAHRMSLVAMHAGALAYRTDLPPAQVAETAALVRDSAHEALGELREVLGVLRGLDGPTAGGTTDDPRPERPQPTLADLDELVAATTAAGTPVRVTDRVPGVEALPVAISRSAYRIVQEALTNVRKHAPGVTASVVLRGAPGQGLWITVSNATPAREPADDTTRPPSSGLGLLGLMERAELGGGTLTARDADGRFVVQAWLPWTA
ncbi:sensor histidine kinase [Isoptericola jiangsuensis]|uniref:sensor histidine kinase n=1 Tax=Isoptericola jiangsuensis TaxID=548579 RepID=UPI001FEA555F|nr:histidine kinase [Isoptericola jiangsuensis]